MKYRPKHISEYVALRITAALLQVLPYRIALTIGWLLARIAFHLFRFRQRETRRRIRQVFPDIPPQRVRQIAWLSLRNLAFNAVEMMRSPRASNDWVKRIIPNSDQAAAPILNHCRETGRGAIVGLPHMGNWELTGLACYYVGIPIFNIAAKQRNPLVNDYLTRLRQGPGIETLERGAGTLRTVLRRLRQGSVLAILPDVRMRTPDLELPFLGFTANLGRGMAQFARRADVPIFPCIVRRQGWFHLEATVFPAVEPDPSLSRDADIDRMTHNVIAIVDAAIRDTPEQWFWYNRRWVLEPVTPDTPAKDATT